MKHKELERWHRLNLIKKALQVLVVLSVIACAVAFGIGHLYPKPSETFVEPPVPDDPDGIRIEKFQYSSPGANPWDLEAESATVSKTLDRAVVIKPRISYHRPDGTSIVLSADQGQLDKQNSNFSVKGNVVVQFKDFVFETAEMEYSDKSRMARTSAPVALKGTDIRVTGTGLTIDVDRQEMMIQQDVKASLSNVKWVGPGERLPL